jgi:hypothetical protein
MNSMTRMSRTNRKEQIYALVTDEGATANVISEAIKMGHPKVRTFLFDLANEGRIFRAIGPACVAWYFLTKEAANRFTSGALKMERVQAAITESGWTVRRLMAALGWSRETVDIAVDSLERAGKIHSVKWRNATTYFPTLEAAKAFQFGTKPTPALPPTVAVKTKTSFDKRAQIVIPTGVKVQECPPFKGLGFAEPVSTSGDFSRIGIGRYLPAEDRRLARKAA